MDPNLLNNYFTKHHHSRRDTLRLAGALGAAAAVSGPAAATAQAAARGEKGRRPHADFDDVPFDYADPDNLSDWAPSRYGPDDQRGSFNEVTPEKTAAALGLLRGRPTVTTYNLGELMFNGFPAFKTNPTRTYEQRLTITGYEPPDGFEEDGGIVTSREPLGDNQLSLHEERFEGRNYEGYSAPYATTYQIATQIDNLNHVGADEFFYNGLRGPDIAASHGTTKLGNEHMGPIATRGVLLDVLGVKIANGQTSDLAEPASNGKPLLRENYRITVEDIEEAMDFGGINQLEPGDAVMFRTGWNQLLARRDPGDIERWEASNGLPGPYLRESRWLAQFRPAVVASDTWALEVVGSDDNQEGISFPVHQELMMRHGIRIGESYVLDGPADDHVYEFVFVLTPQYAEGATAGNTPPVALGRPRL